MKICPQCDTGYPDNAVTCPTHGGLLSEIIDLRPGMLIRKTYRIERLLGKGGMGSVYLARHELMDAPRALKFLSHELNNDEAFTRRFLREGRMLRQVRHKNVVDCGDLERAEDERLFFAMEFVDGRDLRGLMRQAHGRLDVAEALAIAHGIAEGLGAAHALGMVHRDIKPENVLMARDKSGWVPKIADFGIVATVESSTVYKTTRGSLLTPPYAAPEQWRGTRSSELDGRTDLYALGGVLFEMLTGQTVFEAENYEGWLFAHMQTPPRPPSSLRQELAGWKGLDALVLRLLAKDREDRPRDVAELLGILDAVRPVAPERQPTVPEIRKATQVEEDSFRADRNQVGTEMLVGVLDNTYADSPFRHDWWQYDDDPDDACLTLRQEAGSRVPRYFLLRGSGTRKAVRYPSMDKNVRYPSQVQLMAGLRLPGPFCGITFRASSEFVWYVWIYSHEGRGHFVACWPNQTQRELLCGNEWTIPVDPALLDGSWHTLIVDLRKEVAMGFQEKYAFLSSFWFRGNVDIANIFVSSDLNLLKRSVIDPVEALSLPTPSARDQKPHKNLGLNPGQITRLSPEPETEPETEKPRRGPKWIPEIIIVAVVLMVFFFSWQESRNRDSSLSSGSPAQTSSGTESYQHPYIKPAEQPQQDAIYQQAKALSDQGHYKKAVPLLDRACKAGDAQACSDLGHLYQWGPHFTEADSVTEDYSRALKLLTKACDAGNADGCTNLGSLYDLGSGVPQNFTRAAALYSKGCDGGNAVACNNLGVQLMHGAGVPEDKEKARQILQKGCSLGEQSACDWLKQL
ncbi:MAG: serine/threonine-protein kinase [Terracidiphilus sp.]|jgi:serine/threonine-protein kinase